jgi:hypothetical protein
MTELSSRIVRLLGSAWALLITEPGRYEARADLMWVAEEPEKASVAG